MARNRTLVERAYAVAGDLLGPEARMLLRHNLFRQAERALSRYNQAGATEKALWCEHQWRRVDSGDMAHLQEAGIVAALRAFRLRTP